MRFTALPVIVSFQETDSARYCSATPALSDPPCGSAVSRSDQPHLPGFMFMNNATNLAGIVAFLRNQGISVFTYPLTVQWVRPRLLSGTFQIGITGPPGEYGVFSSTNLAHWSELGVASNKLGAINFTDVTARLSSRKFYRALLQNPPANMVFIPPSTFTMGSPPNELDRQANEGPQTTVTLSRGFWIGTYEVTP